jgi:hypothetical protein
MEVFVSETFVQQVATAIGSGGSRLGLSIPANSSSLDGPHMRIHREWFTERTALVLRIQAIICGCVEMRYVRGEGEDETATCWHFDPNNNWWLYLYPETREIHLVYRYRKTDDEWQALKTVIEMFLG